ncbi:MAG: c-type cytochrome [Arenicella sp.]|nr:c-type cytochrome [Arenicella sp.]
MIILKQRCRTTFLISSILSILISAETTASDPIAGKEIYNTTCVACHGAKAEGNDAVGAPALAGQHENYLVRQLANYNQGFRGAGKSDSFGQQMAAIAVLVKDPSAQANVSAYLASLGNPSSQLRLTKPAVVTTLVIRLIKPAAAHVMALMPAAINV